MAKDLFTPLKQNTDEALPENEPQEIAPQQSPQQSQMPAKPMEAIPGLEEFDTDDLIIPRISLAQGLTQAVVDGKVGMGDIFNNITEEVIGKMKDKKASITIVPVLFTKSRVCYAPRNEADIQAIVKRYPDIDQSKLENRNTLICSAQDSRNATGDFGLGSQFNPSGLCANCRLKDFLDDDTPPSCVFFRNFFVLIEGYDFDLPLIVSFGKTSAKAGRKLANVINTLCRARRTPIWEFKFELSSRFEDKANGKYYVWETRPAGKTDDSMKEKAAMFYQMLQSTKFKIQDDKESSVPIPEDDVMTNEEASF